MVRKLFALASVSALGGLVATVAASGCSSTELIASDAGTDARREASRPPPSEEPNTVSCKAEGVFQPEALKPPAPQTNACTSAQIDAIAAKCVENNADPNGADCTAIRASDDLGVKTCAECIFGTDTDSLWKVINLNPSAETRRVRFNQAGCIEHTSGVTGCGSELFTLNSCLNAYCSECETDGDIDACLDEVLQGETECAPHLISVECRDAAFIDATKDAVNDCFAADLNDTVRLFKYMATVGCATAPKTDGGVDDAGGDAGDAGDGGGS